MSLLDSIAYEHSQTPEAKLNRTNIRKSVAHWLAMLSVKQSEVLSRRFGLLGHHPATLEEVGNAIGHARERVRKVQIEALKRLRDLLEAEDLSLEVLFQEQ